MDLFDYIRAFRKRIVLIVGGVVLCLAAAVVVSLTLPEKYEARATLTVEESLLPSDEGSSYPDPRAVESALSTYEDLVKSSEVMEAAVDEFDLSDAPHRMSWQGLRKEAVNVGKKRGTQLIAVTVTLEDPELATRLANFVARSAVERVSEVRKDSISSSRETLEDEMKAVREELSEAEEALVEYQKTSGLTTMNNNHYLAALGQDNQFQLSSSRTDADSVLENRYTTLLNQWRYMGYGRTLLQAVPGQDDLPVVGGTASEWLGRMEERREEVGRQLEELHGKVSERLMKLHELRRDLDLKERAYAQIADRYNQVSMDVLTQSPGLKLADRALVPPGPSSPKRRLIVAGTGFASLFVFLFLAAFMEFVEMERARRTDGS